MRRLPVGVLLAIPLFASAAGPKRPVDLTMTWIVGIDKNGVLGSMKPAEEKNLGLYQRLETGIRKYWKFTAGKIDGKPELTQTTLTVHATLEPIDGYYTVRVHDAATGPRYDTTVPPKYPDDAVMARRGGAVLLDVKYDASGHVTDAKAIAGGEPKPGHDVERAAVLAVKQWTFKPEAVGGHGLAGKVRVPLCFAPVPAMEKQCRWEAPDTKKPLDADRPFALTSVVHIETDVTAHEL
jgi:TonB family protein